MLRTYSAGQIAITFTVPGLGAVLVTGFAEGSFVTVERDEQTFTKTVGADGTVVRTKNMNKAGKITLKTLKTSPANALLSAIMAADENLGTGVGVVQVKDLGGTELAFSPSCWIQKPPNIEDGKDLPEREWVLDTGPLQMVID